MCTLTLLYQCSDVDPSVLRRVKEPAAAVTASAQAAPTRPRRALDASECDYICEESSLIHSADDCRIVTGAESPASLVVQALASVHVEPPASVLDVPTSPRRAVDASK